METIDGPVSDKLRDMLINASMLHFWLDRIQITHAVSDVGIPVSVYEDQYASWSDLNWAIKMRIEQFPNCAFFLNGKCVYAAALSPEAIEYWQNNWARPPGAPVCMDDSSSMM